MGSAKGSSPKLRPRLPIPSGGREAPDRVLVREARRRWACSWSSLSSIPRSWEKSGGLSRLACFSVMLRAAAKGSAGSFFPNFILSVKRSHQSLKRSLTVSFPEPFDNTELFRLCCGMGSMNWELPLFRFTLGVSLRSPTTFDFREAPIPRTPVFNPDAAARNLSRCEPTSDLHFSLKPPVGATKFLLLS